MRFTLCSSSVLFVCRNFRCTEAYTHTPITVGGKRPHTNHTASTWQTKQIPRNEFSTCCIWGSLPCHSRWRALQSINNKSYNSSSSGASCRELGGGQSEILTRICMEVPATAPTWVYNIIARPFCSGFNALATTQRGKAFHTHTHIYSRPDIYRHI